MVLKLLSNSYLAGLIENAARSELAALNSGCGEPDPKADVRSVLAGPGFACLWQVCKTISKIPALGSNHRSIFRMHKK
jgi:hypothetical protein